MPTLKRFASPLAVWIALSPLNLLVAQGPPAAKPADKPAAAPKEKEGEKPASLGDAQPETLLDMILAGGASGVAFMVVLGTLSVVGAAVGLERLVNLTRGKVLPADFLNELRDLARRQEPKPDRYRDLAQRSTAPIARILHAALLRAGRPLPEVEKSMEDTAGREVAALRSSVRALSVIGNVAPLVGLLGTVIGMIDAFRVASQAGLGKAELLARGIYLALLTTAAGLIIAIPCVLLAAFFYNRIDKLMWETDACLIETMPSFALMEQGAHLKAVATAGGNPLKSL